jgi:hypothetical protein
MKIEIVRPVRHALVTAAAGLLMMSALPGASNAAVFNFILHDHPDGSFAPPPYGLRLDGLFGNVAEEFTFSFDQAGTGMTLAYDDAANTIRIQSRAFGGNDTGTSWDAANSGVVDIDFTYQANVATDGNGVWGTDTENLGVVVTEDAQNLTAGNFGTLTLGAGTWTGQSVGDIFTMVDQDNGSFSFKLNNFDDHRLAGHGLSGPETFVGWGWLNHAEGAGVLPTGRIYDSDWLFTAELLPPTSEVPEPGVGLVLGLGLGTLALYRRRASKKTA